MWLVRSIGAEVRNWRDQPIVWRNRSNQRANFGALSLGGVVAEDLGSKGLDFSAFSPGIRRQAGFEAGLFEKGDAIPFALDGNLRQEEAAAAVLADKQAVAPDFNGFRFNGLWS